MYLLNKRNEMRIIILYYIYIIMTGGQIKFNNTL